jgi:Flavin reductase like domain
VPADTEFLGAQWQYHLGFIERRIRIMNQDALLYRRLFGRFATGVAVVMSEFEGDVVGMTVNSLTSVSLDPLLLLFCARNGSRSAQAVLGTGRFSVNILNGQQQDIARGFAGSKHVSCLSDCVRSGGFAWLPRSNAVFLCESKNVAGKWCKRLLCGRWSHGRSHQVRHRRWCCRGVVRNGEASTARAKQSSPIIPPAQVIPSRHQLG